MPQINVNIRMDNELKKEFEETLDEMGLTMTAAFNIFAKTVVRQKKIPFEISAIGASDSRYSKIKEIKEIDFDDAIGEELLDE